MVCGAARPRSALRTSRCTSGWLTAWQPLKLRRTAIETHNFLKDLHAGTAFTYHLPCFQLSVCIANEPAVACMGEVSDVCEPDCCPTERGPCERSNCNHTDTDCLTCCINSNIHALGQSHAEPYSLCMDHLCRYPKWAWFERRNNYFLDGETGVTEVGLPRWRRAIMAILIVYCCNISYYFRLHQLTCCAPKMS